MAELIDFDFHSHTFPQSYCATQTIKELVKKAYLSGVKVLALTNHDTLNGLSEAREECEKYGIEFINGIELTCNITDELPDLNGTIIHILGHNVDNNVELFDSYLAPIKKASEQRILALCEFLRGDGYDIDDCTELTQLWAQMVDKNGYPDMKRAKHYIYSDEIELRFPTPRLSHRQAIELIHKLNGLATWAHPTRVWLHDKFSASEMEYVVDRLCDYGLDGLEVFHPHNLKDGAIPHLLSMAQNKRLNVTLGSDSHHLQDKDGYLPLCRELNDFDFDYGKIKYFWKRR